MTGCKDSNTALPVSDIDARLGNLVPEVVSLLQRITSVEPAVTYEAGTNVKFTSELSFPDGIGEGEIAAELFVYRDAVRLDLHLEHNRVFATGNDTPSERRCYLNDYVASVTLDADQESLPNDFVRGVVAGVAAARDAVRRHNRRASLPWHAIRVAVREPEFVG
ncbi:MAG: hypothetical protein O7F70_01585 [Gemmatimonadetes bacterium]|jgi:hypothetical protein|nr:hypothetical protein [Gemmatimonadota bacterium]